MKERMLYWPENRLGAGPQQIPDQERRSPPGPNNCHLTVGLCKSHFASLWSGFKKTAQCRKRTENDYFLCTSDMVVLAVRQILQSNDQGGEVFILHHQKSLRSQWLRHGWQILVYMLLLLKRNLCGRNNRGKTNRRKSRQFELDIKYLAILVPSMFKSREERSDMRENTKAPTRMDSQ